MRVRDRFVLDFRLVRVFRFLVVDVGVKPVDVVLQPGAVHQGLAAVNARVVPSRGYGILKEKGKWLVYVLKLILPKLTQPNLT